MFTVVAGLASTLPLIALVAIPILLIRALGPVDLSALFRAPSLDAWPRGVQEEEPRPWRLAVARSLPGRGPAAVRGAGPALPSAHRRPRWPLALGERH
ncbi:MAG: hypothetical protein ACP5VP_02450 [Candidatus Limnocylindrales bacterium]